MSGLIDIAYGEASDAEDRDLVQHLTQLINDVYDVAEAGFFIPEHKRITTEEISRLISAGKLALARLHHAENGKRVVGCVKVYMVDATTGGLGPLCADPKVARSGLGKRLVNFAEEECRKLGATKMQLELLVPATYESKSKAWIQAWYERMGYILIREAAVEDILAWLLPDLATPAFRHGRQTVRGINPYASFIVGLTYGMEWLTLG